MKGLVARIPRAGTELIFALDPPPDRLPDLQPVRLRVDLHRVLRPEATRGLFQHLFLVRGGEVVLAQGAPGLRLGRLNERRPVRRRRADDETALAIPALLRLVRGMGRGGGAG